MAVGDYRHLVTFQNPGTNVPDGDGGFSHAWDGPCDPPTWYVAIQPAAPQDLERFAAGSIMTMATHVVRGRHHPAVSTATRMVWDSRTFSIVGTRNVDERSIDMECMAVEVVAGG